MPMHVFGHPVDIEELIKVAQDISSWNSSEDACRIAGGTVTVTTTPGTFGRVGTFSFNGNKTITTGGGGAIVTNDLDLARRAERLSTTAKVQHPWAFVHDAVGYNYRMPNINAALGCAQLEQLPHLLAAKRTLFEKYGSAFANLPSVRILGEREDVAAISGSRLYYLSPTWWTSGMKFCARPMRRP